MNRRALTLFLEKNLHSAKRYGIPFSVILIDIDDFKLVNDTYGHQTGDRVLKEFAKLMKALLRKTDVFGRWGGEEFLAVLPFNENPLCVAEKLCTALSRAEFRDAGRITASFGATVCRTDDTIDSLIGRADRALYKAKELGKNQVALL